MRYDKIPVIYLSLIISILSFTAKAQLSFSNLLVENGLSQNSVISIAQDSMGLMWFGTRQGLNRYDGYRFKVYKSDQKNQQSISGNEISSLLTDNKKVLWVGTTAGLNRYNSKTDDFLRIKALRNNSIEVIYQDWSKHIWVGTLNGLNLMLDENGNHFHSFKFSNKAGNAANSIYAVSTDQDKNVWVGTGSGLFVLKPTKGGSQYKKIKFWHTLPSNYITAVSTDQKQRIWIGTANGLCMFDPLTNRFKVFQHDNKNHNSLIHNDIREVMVLPKGKIWIGTQDGLSILDATNNQFVNYQHDPEINSTLSHNSIHNIFVDRNRNIWVGTYFGGVNVAYPVSTRFKIYRNSRVFPGISGNVVSTVLEDAKHNLWIGTEGGGLNYFNRATNTFKSYKTNSADSTSLSSNLVKIMVKESPESDKLIVGTHRGGLNIFDPLTGKFQRIKNVRDSLGNIGAGEIVALEVDRRGTIWIGSFNGLSTLQKKSGYYPRVTTKSFLDRYLHNKYILSIFEDSRGNLWIGTNAGLYRYAFDTKRLTVFHKNDASQYKLRSEYINCITEDSTGNILVGTDIGGISIYDPKTNRFKTYGEAEGLINNNVLGIVEDQNHNLWISTANGLSELEVKTGRFRNYTKSDGLAGNEFNARSYFIDSRGEIFLGGINGLTAFHPKDIQLNEYVLPIAFTGLRLFNQPVAVNGSDKILPAPVNEVDKLVFAHDQNNFTIEFALLNFVKPDKNKYAYLLKGFDRGWNFTANPSATYTNLAAGTYTFLVKGVNNDGIPSAKTASIDIKILPAWWASWWAYIIYLIIISSILFLTIRYLFVKALLKRTEDVQQMKLRFFTNVSHEIRTPLTLILAPLENLLQYTKNLPEINRQVIPIKQNADRLMRLVTELMDFRKTETGNLRLHTARQDIVAFMQEIFQAFAQLAESRNITYRFNCNLAATEIWFDKIQMEKVFFNLLSNAFKFTKNEGTISISLTEESNVIKIVVSDNGIGIPENSKDKLFKDFFQVESPGFVHIGSGIGLALSKSIVVAHGGQLLMESRVANAVEAGNTSFTVILKKGENITGAENDNEINALADNEYLTSLIPLNLNNEEPKSPPDKTRELVLIVEDNIEIRQLLRNALNGSYQILEAENGEIGWEIASTQLPALVVCDVMMPVMDGLELCKKLKTDERTAHVPVVLLTARASHLQQIDGLETGADSYITKPFSIELLLLNIRNLLQSRANMRRKFSEQVNLQPQDVTINTIDHKFMARAIAYIEEHMADQEFGVQELAKEIGMSQPVLYKKIRAITDLSVNDFIKSIRLKKAALLLQGKIHNVAEVAYLVGFNDPKYFSREFRKQFGHTPRLYLANLEKNKTT